MVYGQFVVGEVASADGAFVFAALGGFAAEEFEFVVLRLSPHHLKAYPSNQHEAPTVNRHR